MSASMSSELRAEPNLTPLLDVVFQLITFFMLVINFSTDNYDQRIQLPVAGSARPIDEEHQITEDRLVLNVDRDGHLLARGEALPINEAVKWIKHEASLIKLNLQAAGIKFDPVKGLPTTIVLRADMNMTCDSFQRILDACQAQGFRKFSLKAKTGT